MKLSKNKLIVSTATVLLALFATTAFAQQYVVTLDENGRGNINGTSPLPFAVGPDPVSGISTLYYVAPIPLTPGDVLLFEDAASGIPSDLIRFGGPNNSYIYFFSDKEATDVAPFDLADVDHLPPPAENFINLLETGIEGQNGAIYNPTPGQPGSYPGLIITYNIMSDVIVPEPSGLALVSVGGGLLLLFRRRLYSRNC